MKINDYPEIDDLSQGDKLVVETPDGTKKIDGSKIGKKDSESITLETVALHRNTYRGKNLGTSFTDEQKESIRSGTFEDLYVGDYWLINGITWRIMDINALKTNNAFYSICESNHLIVMPDKPIYKDSTGSPFNTNDYSNSLYKYGYSGSRIYTVDNTICKDIFENAFGSDYLLTFKYASPSSISQTGVIAANTVIELKCMSPKITNIFGGMSTTQPTVYAGAYNNYNTIVCQFSAFMQKPELISISSEGLNVEDSENSKKYKSSYISSDFGLQPCTCLLIGLNNGVTASLSEYGLSYRPFACIG